VVPVQERDEYRRLQGKTGTVGRGKTAGSDDGGGGGGNDGGAVNPGSVPENRISARIERSTLYPSDADSGKKTARKLLPVIFCMSFFPFF